MPGLLVGLAWEKGKRIAFVSPTSPRPRTGEGPGVRDSPGDKSCRGQSGQSPLNLPEECATWRGSSVKNPRPVKAFCGKPFAADNWMAANSGVKILSAFSWLIFTVRKRK